MANEAVDDVAEVAADAATEAEAADAAADAAEAVGDAGAADAGAAGAAGAGGLLDRATAPFPWDLPDGAFATLVGARLATGLTWLWMAWTAAPWSADSWFEDALLIADTHSGFAGGLGFAEAMLGAAAFWGVVFFLINLGLGLSLLTGFLTRLSGGLALGWAAFLVLIAYDIPKRGTNIPADFPVPIGGWLWLLGPVVVFPLVALASSGRWMGVDMVLRERWAEEQEGWKARLLRFT